MSRAPASTISLKDDFDYPMPKRETNWTLKNESRSTMAGRAQATPAAALSSSTASSTSGFAQQQQRSPYSVADIDGAQAGTTSMFRSKRFDKKPNLFSNADIEGSSPTRNIPTTVNKDNTRNLRNEDIEHSYPESKLFSTPRVVNPLEPCYPLPAVRHRVPTPPVQKHETLKVSDIPGARAKPAKLVSGADRNPLDYSDVSVPAARKRQTESMALQTHDIIHGQRDHARHRDQPISPLEPSYTVSGPNGQKVVIGSVPGSKPKGLPPARSGPMYSLVSNDIDGATPGNRLPFPKVRREWKATCDVSDIPGASRSQH